MNYYQYNFICDPQLNEILIAFLSQQPFDTFQEQADGLAAYLPESQHELAIDQYIEDLKERFSFQYEKVLVAAQNWNAVWEANFQPIIVGDFCALRADFHAPIQYVQHELIIQPKMAFGTGHHATTFQMIQLMEILDFNEKKVLDYGCGTGVLAILASKLGATAIDAIDIDEWSEVNTLENAELNQVQNIRAILGDLSSVKQQEYDLILANITYNVISASFSTLYNMVNLKGYLLTSGFFPADAKNLIQQAEKIGFIVEKQTQKEKWACVLFRKRK